MKGYIRAKNKVNPRNRFRNIHTFLMQDRRRKLAHMAAILDFSKIFSKDIYLLLYIYFRIFALWRATFVLKMK